MKSIDVELDIEMYASTRSTELNYLEAFIPH